MPGRKLLVLFTANLLVVVNSQFSLGALGGGILQSHNLHNGGLHFPNADGSGPQANNLAAAIYGVAIPPGFGGFSSSENYFGNAYTSNGPQPSDLLIGTGLHTTGRGNPFLGGGDLSGSATSHGIDTVAALFGQVLPSGNDHPGFHPGLIGTGESAFAGIGVPSSSDLGENSSPVAVSLKFNLPTFVELPDAAEFKSNSLSTTDFLQIPKETSAIDPATVPVDADTKPFHVETHVNIQSPPPEINFSDTQFQKLSTEAFKLDVPARTESNFGPADFTSTTVHADRDEIEHQDPPHTTPHQVVVQSPEKPHPKVKSTSNPYLVSRSRHPSGRNRFSGPVNHHAPRAERLTAEEPDYVAKDVEDSYKNVRLSTSSSRVDQRRYSLLPAGYRTDI